MKRRREVVGIAAVVALMVCVPAGAQEAPPAPAPEPAPAPVAQVGSATISEDDFEHWFAQAVNSHFRRPVVLAPPLYEHCVAVKRRQRAAKGWGRLVDPALREQCRRNHAALRRMTMRFLIQGQWVEQEAQRRGLQVSERRVQRVFVRQRRAAFPNKGAYRRFLRRSGASEDGIKYRIRLDVLQNRITREVLGGIRGARREQLALARFIVRFRKRSMTMTWCADGYEIAECGKS